MNKLAFGSVSILVIAVLLFPFFSYSKQDSFSESKLKELLLINKSSIEKLKGSIKKLRKKTAPNIPIGTVLAFSGPLNKIPKNWLPCDGRMLSGATFPSLFKILGYRYGGEANGRVFRLPDYRGVFLRGLDLGRGFDKGRTLGSLQSSQNKKHRHFGNTKSVPGHSHSGKTGSGNRMKYRVVYGSGVGTLGNHVSGWSGGHRDAHDANYNASAHTHNFTTSKSPHHFHKFTTQYQGSGESRPRNISVVFIIRSK